MNSDFARRYDCVLPLDLAVMAFVEHGGKKSKSLPEIAEYLRNMAESNEFINEETARNHLAFSSLVNGSKETHRLQLKKFVRFAQQTGIPKVTLDTSSYQPGGTIDVLSAPETPWLSAWKKLVLLFLSHPKGAQKPRVKRWISAILMEFGCYLNQRNEPYSLSGIITYFNTLTKQNDNIVEVNQFLLSVKQLNAWMVEFIPPTIEQVVGGSLESLAAIAHLQHSVQVRPTDPDIVSEEEWEILREEITDPMWKSLFWFLEVGVTLRDIKFLRVVDVDLQRRLVTIHGPGYYNYQYIVLREQSIVDLAKHIGNRMLEASLSRKALLYPTLKSEIEKNQYLRPYLDQIQRAQQSSANQASAQLWIDQCVNPTFLPPKSELGVVRLV